MDMLTSDAILAKKPLACNFIIFIETIRDVYSRSAERTSRGLRASRHNREAAYGPAATIASAYTTKA